MYQEDLEILPVISLGTCCVNQKTIFLPSDDLLQPIPPQFSLLAREKRKNASSARPKNLRGPIEPAKIIEYTKRGKWLIDDLCWDIIALCEAVQ